MTRRPETNSDLRKTGDRHMKKLRRRAQFRARTKPVRDRVRLLALLTPLVQSGALRR